MGTFDFLLPSGEKVAREGRMRGLVQLAHRQPSLRMSGSPLIRLAPRATFSPEGRRK